MTSSGTPMWHRRSASALCGAVPNASDTLKAKTRFSFCSHSSLRCARNTRAAAVEPGMAPNCQYAANPLRARLALSLRMRRVMSIRMSCCPSAMGLNSSRLTPERDNDDQPPQPTPAPPSNPAPPAAAPAEPYALHNPAAVRQHLRALGEQDVLCLRTSGTSTRIWAATLVQAAILGEGVRGFLFDAFLHVARHDRPPRATPDSESPPPTGSRIWVPPIDWGRHLVGHPVPERDSAQGRTRYREPNMAHPPPGATPDNTKEWERETWVARMASLSNFRHHVPGDIPSPTTGSQPPPRT